MCLLHRDSETSKQVYQLMSEKIYNGKYEIGDENFLDDLLDDVISDLKVKNS